MDRMPSYKSLAALYVADLRSRCSDTHASTVERQLGLILATVPRLSKLGVLEFRRKRIEEDGVSHRTANAEVKALSACFEWGLREAGVVKDNPYRLIRQLPETAKFLRKRRRAMTDAEIRRFLKASCERDKDLCRTYEMTLLWRTLLETGMRWSECVSLTGADIERETIILPPERTKNGEGRAIPIRPSLAAKLKRRARNGSAIFPTPTGADWTWNHHTALRIFRNTLKRAEIPEKDTAGREIDIHACRHTFNTKLHRCGVRESLIDLMLGHSRPREKRTNRRYNHLDVEDLRRELRRKVWRL